jgi:UbiD family decarboxylase
MATPQTQTVPHPFDLRLWLQNARALGQLQEVEGADLKYELGAIAEINSRRGGPPFLFDKFAGYPAGYRVITGAAINPTTLALTLGIEGLPDKQAIVDRVSQLLHRADDNAGKFPMEWVSSGPVMENSMVGDQVDLTRFPTPIFHEHDGGPYIGTGVVQINKDPDSEWVNTGTYRVHLLNQNTLGNFISETHHGHVIRKKFWDKGLPSPVVMSFGHHPLMLIIGSFELPEGVDEMNWIGAIAGARVPVIRGPVTGLPIPAYSEIAIEGYAYPGKEMMEGPFGEFTGYYAGDKTMQPCVEVKAVYYRNQPIMLATPPGRPPHDYSYYGSVMKSAAIKESLRKAGVPGVKAVWVSEASSSRAFIVTSIKQQYGGHAIQAAAIAAFCQAGVDMARYSIVVDDDIDPTNPNDVIWALSSRSDPATDIEVIRQGVTNTLDPTLSPEAKKALQVWNSRAMINACKPYDRLLKGNYPLVAECSPEMIRKTKEKWGHLFK